MTQWRDRTPEQKQVIAEAKKRHRQQHYLEVLEKERLKNLRYRENNREKIREKARAKYVQIRELAGKPVTKEYKPRETPGNDAPVILPRKFGGLDKICTVTS